VENKIRTRFVRPQCSVGYHGSVGYILETAIKKKRGERKRKERKYGSPSGVVVDATDAST